MPDRIAEIRLRLAGPYQEMPCTELVRAAADIAWLLDEVTWLKSEVERLRDAAYSD